MRKQCVVQLRLCSGKKKINPELLRVTRLRDQGITEFLRGYEKYPNFDELPMPTDKCLVCTVYKWLIFATYNGGSREPIFMMLISSCTYFSCLFSCLPVCCLLLFFGCWIFIAKGKLERLRMCYYIQHEVTSHLWWVFQSDVLFPINSSQYPTLTL